MAVLIHFPDDSIINIPEVPVGWFWIDVADALFDKGEITENQLDMIYNHPQGEDEALGSLEFGNLVKSQSAPVEREMVDNISDLTANREPRILSETKITTSHRTVVTHQTFEMPARCSSDGCEWVATLISVHEPISSTKPTNTAGGGSSHRIHLILDDSGSMRKGGAFQQLKKGVFSFLQIVGNAQVGIRWFNSPSLSIRPAGIEQKNCINFAQSKGTNDHAQSLFELVQGMGPNQATVGDIVIMFTDGKPSGKGKNVIEASGLVKKRGARIITIGCGDSEPEFMRMLCSTDDDHHQVDDISNLQDIFRRVGKSLVQRNVHRDDISQSNAIAPARQIQSSAGYAPVLGTPQSHNSRLKTGQGFDYIQDFRCHLCHDEMRIICSCGTTHCGGGLKANTICCPSCGNSAELQIVDTVIGDAATSGLKKGK